MLYIRSDVMSGERTIQQIADALRARISPPKAGYIGVVFGGRCYWAYPQSVALSFEPEPAIVPPRSITIYDRLYDFDFPPGLSPNGQPVFCIENLCRLGRTFLPAHRCITTDPITAYSAPYVQSQCYTLSPGPTVYVCAALATGIGTVFRPINSRCCYCIDAGANPVDLVDLPSNAEIISPDPSLFNDCLDCVNRELPSMCPAAPPCRSGVICRCCTANYKHFLDAHLEAHYTFADVANPSRSSSFSYVLDVHAADGIIQSTLRFRSWSNVGEVGTPDVDTLVVDSSGTDAGTACPLCQYESVPAPIGGGLPGDQIIVPYTFNVIQPGTFPGSIAFNTLHDRINGDPFFIGSYNQVPDCKTFLFQFQADRFSPTDPNTGQQQGPDVRTFGTWTDRISFDEPSRPRGQCVKGTDHREAPVAPGDDLG
jgi:hypothetical protein